MDFKHEYTHAIVGKVIPVLRPDEKAGRTETRRQYDFYLRVLSELNLEVIEIDLAGFFPQNVVVEDVAVLCQGIALMPKYTTDVDKFKADEIRNMLKNELGQTVIELTDPSIKIHGSDVLFTGREFFVGIAESTNEAGAKAIAETFPEYPCTLIKVPKGAYHLKKYITVAGPDILCVGSSKVSKELLKRIEREAAFSYQTLTVPEDDAANVLYVNGTLIHRAIEEIPESFRVFCSKIDFPRRSLCFSKIVKVCCGVSSCCILVKKP